MITQKCTCQKSYTSIIITSITWAGPRCVQELGTFLGPENRTQRRCEVHTIFGDLFTLRQLIRFSVWRSPSIPALSSTGEDGTAWQRALKQFVPLAGSIMPILGGIIQSMVIIQHRAAVAKCSHPHSNSCTLGNCCF